MQDAEDNIKAIVCTKVDARGIDGVVTMEDAEGLKPGNFL